MWLDQDRDVHLEMTPGKLAVQIARNPALISVWTPSLKEGELDLAPLSQAWSPKGTALKPERWSCQRSGSRLILQTESRLWTLEKKSDPGRPRSELTGLWRQVRQLDQKIDYIEFTPWSTLVSVTWQPEHASSKPGQAPATRRIAEWWAYSSDEAGRLTLDGLTRGSARSQIQADYALENNTVTLKLNGTTYTLRKTERVE